MTRIDKHTSGLVIITDDNAEINEGLAYFYSDYYTVAASGALTYVLEVGNIDIHFLYSITSSHYGFSYVTHEGVSSNADGSVITPRNHNREFTDASTIILRLNPTGLSTDGAIQIRRGYDGTAINPEKSSGGSASLNRKVILKRNTKYSLVISNLSTTATNDIMVSMGWDEI